MAREVDAVVLLGGAAVRHAHAASGWWVLTKPPLQALIWPSAAWPTKGTMAT
jgi:hypothetical protein